MATTVTLWTGAIFRMWSLPSCTVGALRAEAARFWRLRPADAVLVDHTGAVWPDSVLVNDATAAAAVASDASDAVEKGGIDGGDDASSTASIDADEDGASERGGSNSAGGSATRASSGGRGSSSRSLAVRLFHLRLRDVSAERGMDPQNFRSARAAVDRPQSQSGTTSSVVPGGGSVLAFDTSPTAASAASLPTTIPFLHPLVDACAAGARALGPLQSLEPRLWRVFTFYAAAGDASDPLTLKQRQWRCVSRSLRARVCILVFAHSPPPPQKMIFSDVSSMTAAC